MRRTLAQIAAHITAPQRYRDGGHVRGPGTGTSDSINIKASNGEFVLPTDTVRKVGVKRLQDLVRSTHEPSGRSWRPAHYADGGLVEDPAKKPNSFGDAAAVAQSPGTAPVQPPAPAAPPPVEGPAPAPAGSSQTDRVAQIPTDGPRAPAADGSQNSWANTETGRNLSNLASALPGSLGGAIPAVARTGGAISGGLDAATRLLNAGAGAAAISSVPGSAAAQSQPTSLAGAGRGMVNPPSVDPSSQPPASPPRTLASIAGLPGPTSDVTRVGNSYSGSNVAGNISVNGNASGGGFMSAGRTSASSPSVWDAPGSQAQTSGQPAAQGSGWARLMAAGTGQAHGGQISTQNMTAADNLAGSQQRASSGRNLMQIAMDSVSGVATPTVRNSTNDWAARNELRNSAVSASSIENKRRWGGRGAEDNLAVQEYRAKLATDQALQKAQPEMDMAALRENGGLQREGLQQRGATNRAVINAAVDGQRNQIERGKLSLAQIAAGYDNRARDRVDRAQADLEAAKTPEVQRSARERLLALAGKAPQNEWGLQVTPATKNMDGSSTQGSVYRYNKTTGETVRVDEGLAKTAAQFEIGKTYVDGNGRRAVYTAQGWKPS